MSGEDRHPCGESPGTVRRSGGDRARRTPATRRGNPAILTRLPIESKSADWPRMRPCSGSISLMDAELTAVRDFLGSYPPYDSLEPAALSALLATMSTVYVRRGTEVIGLGAANDTAYVVRAGAVEIRDTADGLVERAEEGTTFGVSSVRARAGSNYRMVAIEDSLLLTIPGDAFRTLLARPGDGRWTGGRRTDRPRAAPRGYGTRRRGSSAGECPRWRPCGSSTPHEPVRTRPRTSSPPPLARRGRLPCRGSRRPQHEPRTPCRSPHPDRSPRCHGGDRPSTSSPAEPNVQPAPKSHRVGGSRGSPVPPSARHP